MSAEPKRVKPPEFALRLLASRGAAAYLAYLVPAAEAIAVIEEIEAEIRALAEGVAIKVVASSPGAARLLAELPSIKEEVVLIGALSYEVADWRLLDEQRSTLGRNGVMVFVTTPSGFEDLMRVGPNLASWLGGFVFSRAGEDEAEQSEGERSARLEALRAWSGKTDREVIAAAARGELQRDPEYGEWLVLLGRGDLLDA